MWRNPRRIKSPLPYRARPIALSAAKGDWPPEDRRSEGWPIASVVAATLPPRKRACFQGGAGKFQPGNEGQRRLDLITPGDHQQVGEVHARSDDLDQHLPGCRLGRGHVFDDEAVGRAELVAD